MEFYQNISLQNIEGEEWRSVSGYEGLYMVSNLGRIKSLKREIRKNIWINDKIKSQNLGGSKKYLVITLSKDKVKKTMNTHRVVAIAFIDNVENKKCVNHKNGVQTDNRAENLEWVTYTENMHHAFNTGLIENAKGWDSKTAKPVNQLTMEGEIIKTFPSALAASKAMGSGLGNISEVCNKKRYRKSMFGFRWEYKTN